MRLLLQLQSEIDQSRTFSSSMGHHFFTTDRLAAVTPMILQPSAARTERLSAVLEPSPAGVTDNSPPAAARVICTLCARAPAPQKPQRRSRKARRWWSAECAETHSAFALRRRPAASARAGRAVECRLITPGSEPADRRCGAVAATVIRCNWVSLPTVKAPTSGAAWSRGQPDEAAGVTQGKSRQQPSQPPQRLDIGPGSDRRAYCRRRGRWSRSFVGHRRNSAPLGSWGCASPARGGSTACLASPSTHIESGEGRVRVWVWRYQRTRRPRGLGRHTAARA